MRHLSIAEPASRLSHRSRARNASAERAAAQAPQLEVAALGQIRNDPVWVTGFAARRKDDRFYELVEETIKQDFQFGYFRIRDGSGRVISIQPFFLHDQDILAGLPRAMLRYAEHVRYFWPGFLKLRTLMVGCAVGEGCLTGHDTGRHETIAKILARQLPGAARRLGARLIVLKEFPARYRDALSVLLGSGFGHLPSFPNVRLRLHYANFDDFFRRKLNSNMRTKLRRKFRHAAAHPPAIVMETVSDIAPYVDEVYPLYLQVYQRSTFKFELLTEDFIRELGRRMPDKVRFFIWRRQGKAIGFSICMIEGDALYGEYMGLDYSIALDVHTYFTIMRDLIDWAIQRGFRYYCSTGLSYEPKYHLRFDLEPLDLYVRHTSGIANWFFQRLLFLLDPTRHDPVLKWFDNYGDLSAHQSPRRHLRRS